MSYMLNQVRCCEAQSATGRGLAVRSEPRWRSWQSTGACVGSGAMLVLLPKCPMCIAAYIAMVTGAGIAAPLAGHLRFVMSIIFVASLGFLLVRRLLLRPNVDGER